MSGNKKVNDVMKKVIEKLKGDLNNFFTDKDNLNNKIHDLLQPSYKREDRKKWKDENYLIILKRFNSFTPALPRSTPGEAKGADVIKGGGYFLHWKGKGIAIDPGFNFIENLCSVSLSIGDIDAIVVTHGHNDHYIDLDPILTLIYQYNKLNKNLYYGILSLRSERYHEALFYFNNALDFPFRNEIAHIGLLTSLHLMERRKPESERVKFEIDPEINMRILDGELRSLKEIYPDERFEKKIDLFLGRSGQKTVDSFLPLGLEQIENVYLLNPQTAKTYSDYNISIEMAILKHTDLYGGNHCIGLKIDLLGDYDRELLKIGLTSDTGYYYPNAKIDSTITDRRLSDWFLRCELLIAHIGSILKTELAWNNLDDSEKIKDESLIPYLYKNHLGLLGLVKLVSEIKTLKLVVVSEYGEEMAKIRKPLTDALNKPDVFNNNPTFRTGDVGLKIKLDKDLEIHVDNYKEYASPDKVREDDSTGAITYHPI